MGGTAEILQDIDARGLTAIVSTIAMRHGAPIGEIAIPTTDAGRRARNECWATLKERSMRIATIARVWDIDNGAVLDGILAFQESRRPTAAPPSAMTPERVAADERATKATAPKKRGTK